VTPDRDELRQLVEVLPGDQVPAAVDALRRLLRPGAGSWPPAFFGGAPGDGTSIADEADGLLEEGFGR
jgi:hypothetical protein